MFPQNHTSRYWLATLVALLSLITLPLFGQCPENREILLELYYNHDLSVQERKVKLETVIDCCNNNLPEKTCEDRDRCAYALHRLGNLFLKIGELDRGVSKLQAAEELYCDEKRRTDVKADLSHGHSNRGNWAAAAEQCRGIVSSGELITRIPAALQLIEANLRLGKLSDAEFWLDEVAPLEDQLGNFSDSYYELKGMLAQARGNMRAANTHWNAAKSWAIRNHGENSAQYAQFCLSMAENHYVPQEKYQDAQSELQRALIAYIPSFNRTDIMQLPSIAEVEYIDDDIMTILELRAHLFLRQYQKGNPDPTLLEAALECFDLIVASETSLRQYYETEWTNLLMIANRHHTMELALGICYELQQYYQDDGYTNAALHYSELAKDILLKENFKGIESEKNGFLKPELIDWRQTLQGKFAELSSSNLSARAKETRTSELKEEWSNLLREIQGGDERYFQYKYEYSKPTISEIRQKTLGEDQGVIEYFFGEKKSYAIAITAKESAFVEIPLVLGDSDYITDFIDPLSRETGELVRRDFAEGRARELYEILLQPIRDRIDLPERLIIIPDGLIAKIPFDILIEGQADQSDILLNRYAISMANSLGMLLNHQKSEVHKQAKYLGVAPVNFLDEADYMRYSLAEVNAAASLFSGDVLSYDGASKRRVLETHSSYHIIHFATHANDKDEDKGEYYPYIELYGGERLRLPEIYNMDFRDALVILSACDANDGDPKLGESIISLTRGFNYAGAESLLTTQWQAHQESISKLVSAYLKYLDKGLPKDIALTKAKRDYLAESAELYHAPYYWAGVVQFGNTDQLLTGPWWVRLTDALRQNINYLILVGIGLLLFNFFRQRSS